MQLLYVLLNTIWVALCRPESRRFSRALRSVRAAQQHVLLAILRQNSATEFGRQHGFDRITRPSGFQKAVPLADYDDFLPAVRRTMAGEQGVLTADPVTMFELSSGSAAPSKHVPYTATLKKQFLRGINPWVHTLYRELPALRRGRAYWSITPVNAQTARTEGGIPVGFEEDSGYFGSVERYLLDLLFAVPREVKYIADMDAFRYVTLLFLLKEERLSLISVWNPTFLLLLLEPMVNWRDGLIADIGNGTVTPPAEVPGQLRDILARKLRRNPARASELRRVFERFGETDGDSTGSLYEHVWPHLCLISCWTDANAGTYVPELERLFPHVRLQGKGLIATEGFVSLPYPGGEGALLAVRSHFFEFAELDGDGGATGKIRLAHELECGGLYSVIITTGGGLYRYRLKDIVKVVGFCGGCPRLVFMGKEDKVSDLCGEKLHEFHVRNAIERALAEWKIDASFFMLAPERSKDGRDNFYALFLELRPGAEPGSECLNDFITGVEEGLQENFHYGYCRRLGQLGPCRLFVVRGSGPEAGTGTYLRVCCRLGQKAGNVKPYALHTMIGWSAEFPGSYLEQEEQR